MLKKFCLALLSGALCFCGGAATANATPVTFVDDLGSVYAGSFSSYGPGSWYLPNNRYAGQFTASSSGDVTEIDLEIARRWPSTDTYWVGEFKAQVWTSVSGLPGTLLYTSPEQTATAVYPASLSGFNPSTNLQSISVSGLSLDAGQSYFLTVVGSQSTSNIVWWMGSNFPPVDYYDGTSWSKWSYGGPSQSQGPGFKITGNTSPSLPAPEPTSMALLGVGSILASGHLKVKRQQQSC